MSFLSSSSVLVRIVCLLAVGGLAVGAAGCDGGGSSADPPSAPSSVEVTSEDGAVSLSWDGGADTSGYNVYRDTGSLSGTGSTPVNGDAPVDTAGFADGSVENGTLYYYRVTAVGDGGESDPSSEVNVRPFPSPPDDRP